MHRVRMAALSLAMLLLPAAASAADDAILRYRGFTVNMAVIRGANLVGAVEDSLRKQIDIVADCGAKAEVLAFFRSQTITLKTGQKDGGGYFSRNGVEIDAAPLPPKKPIVLHELLHAMHARYLPGGINNPNVQRFYNNALRGRLYPSGAYVLKNRNEFFAVTASLYLWGYVARPPFNRDTLRAKQPVYYRWLGSLFGVRK